MAGAGGRRWATSSEEKCWARRAGGVRPGRAPTPPPPIWIPVTGSKESMEFAARHNIAITPGLRPGGLQDDIIRYYAKCLARNGRKITPDHLSIGVTVYIADSKAQAVKENGPYHLYFNRTLFSHGNFTETSLQRATGYATQSSTDDVRPANPRAAEHAREDFRNMTLDDVARQAQHLPSC